MNRSIILSTGRYLPEKVVTNFDLEKQLNTTDKWIRERTGIEERHYAADNEGAADMGYKAALKALEKANMEPKDIQMIILGTLSPDYNFPGSACLVQDMLGIPGTAALDIRQQCTGFIYGLSIADQYIRSGMYERIMVIGAENHSSGLDFTPSGRDVTVIFGDGAGAAIVTKSPDEKRGILSSHLHADGKYAKALWVEIPASKYTPRLSKEHLDQGLHYPKMEGRKVFKWAVTYMPEAVNEALAANNLKLEDIDLVVPHQANMRINQMMAGQLGLPEEKLYHNIQRYGNTTAATIPICLDEIQEQGRIKPGDLVILVAFGAGFTWGSVAIRW